MGSKSHWIVQAFQTKSKQVLTFFIFFSLCFSFALSHDEDGGYVVSDHPNSILHHSLMPPLIVDWWESGLAFWDFGAATVVTDKYVILTPNELSRTGWMWNGYTTNLPSWHLRTRFLVSGTVHGADGFAIWYVEDRHQSGGPIVGMKESFKGIGFIFDTYDNDGDRESPSIILVQNDGTQKHFNVQTDYKENALGRCRYALRNTILEVEIVYENKTLTLYIAPEGKPNQVCFSINNIEISPSYHWGMTAATGELSDQHQIHYFHLYPVDNSHLDHDPYDLEDDDSDDEDDSFLSTSAEHTKERLLSPTGTGGNTLEQPMTEDQKTK